MDIKDFLKPKKPRYNHCGMCAGRLQRRGKPNKSGFCSACKNAINSNKYATIRRIIKRRLNK